MEGVRGDQVSFSWFMRLGKELPGAMLGFFTLCEVLRIASTYVIKLCSYPYRNETGCS
jgi:hypothetical protein